MWGCSLFCNSHMRTSLGRRDPYVTILKHRPVKKNHPSWNDLASADHIPLAFFFIHCFSMTVSHPWSSNGERVFQGAWGIIFTHELAITECGPQPSREFLWDILRTDPSILLLIQGPETHASQEISVSKLCRSPWKKRKLLKSCSNQIKIGAFFFPTGEGGEASNAHGFTTSAGGLQTTRAVFVCKFNLAQHRGGSYRHRIQEKRASNCDSCLPRALISRPTCLSHRYVFVVSMVPRLWAAVLHSFQPTFLQPAD